MLWTAKNVIRYALGGRDVPTGHRNASVGRNGNRWMHNMDGIGQKRRRTNTAPTGVGLATLSRV